MPGEVLPFKVEIDNKSSREIADMSINIIQRIFFHATAKTKICVRNVAHIKYPKRIPEKAREVWSQGIIIPAVCASSNGTCRIIQVNYCVLFNFNPSGIAASKDLEIPLTIGTIPLRSQSNNMQQGQVMQSLPPSFQACMFGNENSANFEPASKGEIMESNSNSFMPMYPYYQDFSNAQK